MRTLATDRARIVAYVAVHTDFDATSVRIVDDVVTAIKDPDKTFNAPETQRVALGFVEDVLAAADAISGEF